MQQTWHDLLFAHWTVRPSDIRPLVPRAFDLDLYDGQAWIGIVPFYMTNVTLRGIAPLPKLSEFAELNVRTYVRVAERGGVYFLSLDAANRLAVCAAKLVLNLPYHRAAMNVSRHAASVEYQSHRLRNHGARFEAEYSPFGRDFSSIPGSLEHFLTERYCLYNVDRRGVPYRLDIHHPPWALQPAWATVRTNDVARASGLRLPDTEPLLHFAHRQDVAIWGPRSCHQPARSGSSNSLDPMKSRRNGFTDP
jgi:hypothetical protein